MRRICAAKTIKKTGFLFGAISIIKLKFRAGGRRKGEGKKLRNPRKTRGNYFNLLRLLCTVGGGGKLGGRASEAN